MVQLDRHWNQNMIEYTLVYVNEITDPCSNLGASLANLY